MHYNSILKPFFSLIIFFGFLISITYAKTTQQGWEIINKLQEQGRTEDEIKRTFEDLGYDASEYFQTTYNTAGTSQIGWNIIADLRNKGRKDNEIKKAMEDLGYNSSPYFPSGTDYISRNCNIYKIKYIDDLNVYTSDNLQKKEYFINQEYLKRYIDSKNPQKSGCPTNIGWISKSYSDSSSSTDKFIAPNGKVYFIQKTDGKYTSSELISKRYFSSILDLKYHIRDNNPLIGM